MHCVPIIECIKKPIDELVVYKSIFTKNVDYVLLIISSSFAIYWSFSRQHHSAPVASTSFYFLPSLYFISCIYKFTTSIFAISI